MVELDSDTSDTFFGGGLGGDAGHGVVMWMTNLVGGIVTAVLIVVATVAWLLFASGRFAHWLAVAGMKEESEVSIDDMDLSEVVSQNVPETLYDDEIIIDEEVIAASEPEEAPEEIVIAEGPDPETPAEDPQPQSGETILAEGADQPQTAEGGIEIIRNYNPDEIVTEELERIDNRAELERFEFPSIDLLDDYADGQHTVSKEELEINNNRIRATLMNYKIEVMQVSAVVGPTVTLYKVVPAPGVKVSAIENLHREIGMALGAKGVRVVV